MVESGRVAKSGDGTRGKPFNYEFPNSGSRYIRGTSKPESEKVAQTRMDTGSILVPENTQKTILVPDKKQPSEGAISSESEAVENVTEGSLFTPLSDGGSVGTANLKRDSTPESWTEEI